MVNTKDKPRIFWLLARVIRLYPGDDGKVRSVEIKFPNRQVAQYSIKHLCPLEVQTSHVGNQPEQTNANNNEQPLPVAAMQMTDSDVRDGVSVSTHSSGERTNNTTAPFLVIQGEHVGLQL